MKILIIFILSFIFEDTLGENLTDLWLKYKQEYNLNFNKNDDDNFKKNFESNLETIRINNLLYQKAQVSSKLKITKFAHKSFKFDIKPNEKSSNTLNNIFDWAYSLRKGKRDIQKMRINWSEKGYVTSVGDQGECNSNYAFAVAGAVETALAIKNGNGSKLIQLSKEQLVDCTTNYNFRCKGGYLFETLKYAKNFGLMNESSYKYKYVFGNESFPCQEKSTQVVGKINTFKSMVGSKLEILDALQSSPVLANFYVANQFFFYDTGIFDSCLRSYCNELNHFVLIVGFDILNGTEYWIVKNSWGTKWGENGFFRIKAGVNMCCIELSTYSISV